MAYRVSDDEKMRLLTDLIAFKSVNGGEAEVAKYIQQQLSRHGIDSTLQKVADGRDNLIATVGHGKPVIALSGHMDVVSPVDVSQWSTDPFQLTEKGGELYGRGSADMKSGLAAIITTLIELQENGLPKHGTVKFMATVGEEVGGKGSETFYKSGLADDIDALICGEPSGHTIIYSTRGSMDIKLVSNGQTAHSSMPELGYNAINPLLHILDQANQFFTDETASDEKLGKTIFNPTIINGGTQVNSIPDQCVAQMNVRTVPQFNNEQVIKTLQNLVDAANQRGADVQMDVYMSEWPVQTTGKNHLADTADVFTQKYLGQTFQRIVTGGVTDASNLLKGRNDPNFPFMMFGPGDFHLAHTIDEHVNKEEYLKFSDIYRDLVVRYTEDEQ